MGFKLVEGKPISIQFADGRLSATAGCNDIDGNVRIENGTLQTNGLRITEMGCMDATGPQETWLYDLLNSRPTIALKEPRLTIAGKGATLTLVAEKK